MASRYSIDKSVRPQVGRQPRPQACSGLDHAVAQTTVDLDVEFHPTQQRRMAAGGPFTLAIAASPGALRQAATEWDEELAPFPDGLA